MRGLPGPQVPPRNTHADGTSPMGGSSDRLLSVSGKKKCSHCKEELGMKSHYSKSQIFVQKFNFDKTTRFHEFYTPIFLDNYSREIKVINS